MAYRLFGTKPLSEPMVPHCQLDSYFNEILFEIQVFIQENLFENVVGKMAPFSLGLNELIMQ